MTQTLRLCSWNIQLGLRLEAVLADIQREADFADLDLFALQEVSTHDGQDDAQTIASVLGSGYASYQVAAHVKGGHVQANGLVWNSRRVQLSSQTSVLLPCVREARFISGAERALLGALVRQERNSLVAEGVLNDISLRAYVTHLDVLGIAHKKTQFYHILADMRERAPVDLTLLMGDLNTYDFRARPSWGELHAAAEAEGMRNITREIEWTFWDPRLFLKQKLDAIYAGGPRLTQWRSRSLHLRSSDHIPVFSEIVLNSA
jgi:endonuclease/exonuclease/phosphatase family metal-dependent hydrolase